MPTSEEWLTEKIGRIIDEKVRPALQAHGGDISLMEVKGRDVKVRFLGVCSSCPTMQSTMEDIVTRALREELGDKINRVILWNTLSDELIDFAHNFFKHKQP